MLIKAHADVNVSTNDSQTPLDTAACHGRHEKCVAMLIDANADVNSASDAIEGVP